MVNNPIKLFDTWYKKAKEIPANEPEAAVLATASKDGQPSARVILIKLYDENGFCFFTNLTSHKAKDLRENPKASLCFYWDQLGLQVRIEGTVEAVTAKEADDYFAQRDRNSQIGAWASKQSSPMENQTDLKDRIIQISKQFDDHSIIPRPPFWSGYRLVPNRIEFWEMRPYRLHKRTLFSRKDNDWQIETLYP